MCVPCVCPNIYLLVASVSAVVPSARSTFLSQAMAFEGGPAKLFEGVTVSTKPQWCVNPIPGVAQWRSMTTPPGPQWEVFKIEQGDDRSHAPQNMFAYVSMFLPSVVALIFVMLFTYFHSTESTDGWLLRLSFFVLGYSRTCDGATSQLLTLKPPLIRSFLEIATFRQLHMACTSSTFFEVFH